MADATTTEVEAEAETTTRSQMEKHQGFVDWYQSEFEIDLNDYDAAQVIAEFARLRNEFRRSDFYLSQWGPEARDAARQKREQEREALAEKRAAERAAKAEERAKAKAEKEKAKAEAESNGEAPAKKAGTRRRVAKKATPSTIVVDETEGGEDAEEDEVFD